METKIKRAHRRRSLIAEGRRGRWAVSMAATVGVAAVAVATGAGLLTGHAQTSPELDYIAFPEPLTIPVVPAEPPPTVTLGATRPSEVAEPRTVPVMRARQVSLVSPAPATEANSVSTVEAKQAASDSPLGGQRQDAAREAADLLRMATALKAEVDKSSKDTLSVTVVRRAGEIEQMAHKVRTGTTLASGKN